MCNSRTHAGITFGEVASDLFWVVPCGSEFGTGNPGLPELRNRFSHAPEMLETTRVWLERFTVWQSPAELLQLADGIITQMSSSDAIEHQDLKTKTDWDELLRQSAMWNRNVLQYLELHEAMKKGDIGHMEDMLPYLLFWFIGGRNSKYAIKILELLQVLHLEWPADLRCICSFKISAVSWTCLSQRVHEDSLLAGQFPWRSQALHPCWQGTGKKHQSSQGSGYQACYLTLLLTLIQVTFCVIGPFAIWDHIGKICPAIPSLEAVWHHMEK